MAAVRRPMNDLKVSFLYFDGCARAPGARRNLLDALERVRADVKIGMEEVDIMDPVTPEHLRRWGSPTILIDGVDMTGAEQGSALSCRIYTSEGGVPTTREIVRAIRAGHER